MTSVLLLLLGALLIAAGFAVTWYATNGEAVGTARSLLLIEQTTPGSREVARSELPARDRLLLPILDGLQSMARRLTRGGATAKLAHRLDLAGNPQGWTADRVLGAKALGLIVLAVVGLLVGGLSARGVLFAAGGGVLGFVAPNLLLYNQGLKRQDQLAMSLAEALDMLTVCVEAGLGFDAALMQVARAAEGPIAGEFSRVLAEIQIGRGRGAAFGSLRERTTVPELHSFISAIVQSDRLGLPVGDVLREQSHEMRLARRQRAEASAQKLPVKILFPMLLFIFPALFIVVIGPGAIRMMDAFSGIG